jgi:hypothetical protein
MHVYTYSNLKDSVAVTGPYMPGGRKEDSEQFCDV